MIKFIKIFLLKKELIKISEEIHNKFLLGKINDRQADEEWHNKKNLAFDKYKISSYKL